MEKGCRNNFFKTGLDQSVRPIKMGTGLQSGINQLLIPIYICVCGILFYNFKIKYKKIAIFYPKNS